MNKKSQVKLIKSIIAVILLTALISLVFVLAQEPEIENYNLEDYKIQNYNNIFIASEKYSSCSWKPNNIDDGYKECSLEIIIWNKKDSPVNIDMIKDKFDFGITKNIRDNLNFYYSTDYEIYEEKRIKVNNTPDFEDNITEYDVTNVTKIKFSNWKPLDNLTKSIPSGKIVGIKVEFELPKYSGASWNFTYKPLNILLDPYISECGNLNTENAAYTLSKSVNSTGTCFTIGANNITLDCQGYTINYSTAGASGIGYGVYSNKNFTTIKNCIIKEGASAGNSKYAIYFNGAKNGTIENNTITTSGSYGYGISLFLSSTNIFLNNTITTSGEDGYGISLFLSSTNIFLNNKIITSNADGYGISLSSSNSNTFSNNTIITSNISGYGIYLGTSSTNNLSNNNITTSGSFGRGIYLFSNSNSNTLSNNMITTLGSDGYGIRLYYDSNSNTLSNNIITTSGSSSGHGILLESSSTNALLSNVITTSGSSGFGIGLESSLTNTVSNNTIITSGDYGFGIYLSSSSNSNTFSNNTITTSGDFGYGIYVYLNTNNNLFSGMNIKTNNTNGYGIYIPDTNHNFTIRDSILNSSKVGVQELYVAIDVAGGTWNFTNVTRADSSVINVNWTAGANGILNMMWYYRAYVNDTLGNNISNANILAYNSSGALILNLTTNESGWTNISSLIDYINNGGTKSYYSNYTINVSKSCYGTLSKSHNITAETNIYEDVFTLSGLPCVFLNTPENNSNITADYATLNFTIYHPTGNLMEVWVYGSNDTKYFNTSWLYHRKNLLSGNYTYNWSGIPVQPDASTVLLFHFDNRSDYGENDTRVYDFSGNGNNGTVSGAKWNETGKFAGAFEFNGRVGLRNITVNDSNSLDLKNFTISLWFMRRGTGTNGGFAGCYNSGVEILTSKGMGGGENTGVDSNWLLGINNNNLVGCFENTSGGDQILQRGTITIQNNVWYHVAFIINGTTATIYLNGEIAAPSLSVIGTPANNNIRVGIGVGTENGTAGILSIDGAFNGTIDEFVVYNRSLSPEEIEKLAKFPGKHYWQVNVSNGTKTSISDVWEFNLTIPIPPLEFYQYPTVSFYNETVEILLFETNRAVNGTIEYWSISDKSDAKIKDLTDYSTVHEFNITDLTKGTKYNYTINLTNFVGEEKFNLSFNSSFVTTNDLLTSFTFVVVGDMRTQSYTTDIGVQTDVFRNITARILALNPDFVINVGDVVEAWGDGGDTYSNVKNAWKEYTDIVWNLTDHIPTFISIGNHEHPEGENALKRYREVIIHPSNGNGSNTCDNSNNAPCWNETTYWFKYGNSLFISLNSEEKGNANKIIGNQLDWLNKTLNMTGFTNKFVFLHRPIKGSSRNISNADELDQMFDYYNVTAVFTGHDHYYCRNNTATLYIISGGGGATLTGTEICSATDNAKYKEYHFVNITVNGDTIHGNAINMSNGAVLDTFERTTPS